MIKIGPYPTNGTDNDIIQWALRAKDEIATSKKKIDDFTVMVGSADTWTVNVMHKLLTTNSKLKQLQAVARYDNLNRKSIVIVWDAGTLHTFIYNDGKVLRSKSLLEK